MPYGRVNPEAVKRDIDNLTKGRFYKVPQSGDSVFLCPPWAVDKEINYHEVWLHYGLALEAILCPRVNCPICAANKELWAIKDDPDAQKISGEIYAKPYYIYNLIPKVQLLNHKGTFWIVPHASNAEPKVEQWSSVNKDLHVAISNFRGFGFGDIFDPENGNVVGLTKVTGGRDPKFASTQAQCNPQKAKLHPTLMALLDNMCDLTTCYEKKSMEELQALLDVKLALYRSTRGMPSTVATLPHGVITNSNIPNIPSSPNAPANMKSTTNIVMGIPPTPAPSNVPDVPSVPSAPSVPTNDAPPLGAMNAPANAMPTNPVQDLDDFEKSLLVGKK